MIAALAGCGSSSGGAATQKSGSSGATAAADQGPMSLDGVTADPAVTKLIPADVKSRGTLTVAMDLHYPPTSFLAPDNTTAVGYNPDIANLLGKIMGLKIQIKNVSFDSIIAGIQGGRYDFTATNMSATPERLKVLDMISYWSDGSSLLVPKGNPQHLSPNDQSMCGHKIAVTAGTTQQEEHLPRISAACKAAGKPAVDQVVLPDVQAALTQLNSHRIEAVFYDTPQLAWAALQQPSSFELVTPQYKKPSGENDLVFIGLNKDSTLTPALHAAMQSAINGPKYKEALNRWGLGAGAITTSEIAK